MSIDAGPGRPVRDGLYERRDGAVRLHGNRCPRCGAHQFPRSDTCTLCGAPEPDPVLLSDTATLWLWTWVNAPPPGYAGPVPYCFGVVELPEGVRIVSRLALDPAPEPHVGMPMRAATEVIGTDDDGTDVHTWTFVPDGAP